ncbi:MAG TPA: tripartite tricarboxylate transporter substrate binding protein [Burkholderiales bacterium]|nr:tripartite tricarboxylate transporter substrate binding protein [Burkholderiales bacterium]
MARRLRKPARMRLTPLLATLCAAFVSVTAAAQSGDYPNRPVRWIVPFAPSGPTDLMSRAVAEKLTQRLGHQFVVDNRPGAGGNIGAELVAKSAPDGYTLMIGHVGTHAINATLYPRLAFDPVKDFTPITLIATLPLALVIHPSVPAKDVKDLVAYAKANPGKLNFASAGNGGPTHLTGELLKTSAAIDIVHVPYKGNAAALLDLTAGRVQMMFSNMLTAMPHVRAGKLRAIGVSSAKRSPQAPDLPAIAETVPGFNAVPWYGVLGPAGLPRPILTKLNTEIARALAEPDMNQRFVAQGIDLQSSTPEQFGALIKSELVKWRKVVKDSGAKVD